MKKEKEETFQAGESSLTKKLNKLIHLVKIGEQMKKYKSKLNIKVSDYIGALILWCVAIVVTLGFAAIPFQLWLAKVILDHIEVEAHEG